MSTKIRQYALGWLWLAGLALAALACSRTEESAGTAAAETAAVAATDSLPAFPGAEGFGSLTPGGRGGQVLHVTNLDSAGPGSLNWAVAQAGPRIVVFDTSGLIPGDVVIEDGRLTILGQTAPGAGITIRGRLMTRYDPQRPAYEDIVVRFLRVRPGPSQGSSGDGVQFSKTRRVVLDQLSLSWAMDETIDIYDSEEVTVQWCAVEESDVAGHDKGRHNFGMICGPGYRVTVHHTLFANHSRRCPALRNGPGDVRNIVVHNFRDGLSHEGQPERPGSGFNLVGNYYSSGPSDPDIFPFCFADSTRYYLRDNYIKGVGLVQDPWAESHKLKGLQYYAGQGVKAESEFPAPPVTTHDPLQAYELVLASAGCFPRDAVSRRTVQEVREGAGQWGRREPADFMEGLTVLPAPPDADRDGIADDWERAHGLDPAAGGDNVQLMPSGYAAIEEYSHELALKLIGGARN